MKIGMVGLAALYWPGAIGRGIQASDPEALVAAATLGVSDEAIGETLRTSPEEFADRFGVRLYRDAEEMVDREGLDTVVLITRHTEHAVWAERMAALSQRAEFYTLDPEEEMASCKYGRMSGDQFNDHLLRIERSYQRRPIAHFSRLPTHAPGAKAAGPAHLEGDLFSFSVRRALASMIGGWFHSISKDFVYASSAPRSSPRRWRISPILLYGSGVRAPAAAQAL